MSFSSAWTGGPEETVTSNPKQGVERVLMPGEVEFMNRERSMKQGISLPTDVYLELKELAKSKAF